MQCSVYWHFHLGHPIVQQQDKTFWIFFLFQEIGEVLLVINFLKDDHIRLLLEFIGWIEPTSLSIVFSQCRHVALHSGNGETFHNFQSSLLSSMLEVDNPMAFQSLVKISLHYLAYSILEEVCLAKFGQLLLRNQGNHQILLQVFPSCYNLLHICVLRRLEG